MASLTSLDKALNLLDILCQHGRASIKNLSQVSAYPAPTVHRLLSILTNKGYVIHDPQTREYSLGIKFLELGARVRQDIRLAPLVMPAMRELMELSGETVNLVMFEQNEAIYVEQIVNPRSMMLMFTRIGARVPLYCSGVGKAFLSIQDEAFLRQYFDSVQREAKTTHTFVEEAALRDELEIICRQGYATDNEEMAYGVRCAAALIRQSRSVVLGCISISGPVGRISQEMLPQLGLHVRRSAEDISRGLGFH